MVMKDEPVYRLENVSLSYGIKEVLHRISFEIPDGELVGVLGPNGSGKSSLLRLMAGAAKPSEGEIALQGKPLRHYAKRDIAKIVSVLPQENPVDFPFSALEVVLMGRAPYLKGFGWETAEDRKIAREAMEMTDCLQFAGKDVRLLSGGERERVFLARALAQKPKVLLLDEPTTHLDLRHQAEIYRLLKRLHQSEHITILLVLHDLNFAAQVCEKILVLSKHRLVAWGRSDEILSPSLIREIYGIEIKQISEPEAQKSFFLPDFLLRDPKI